jgi:hypothetical protein
MHKIKTSKLKLYSKKLKSEDRKKKKKTSIIFLVY